MSVEILGLSRRFGEAQALRDVSLSIAARAFVALLGPSGSGKTTLLRILAGLDFADSGTVRIEGRDMAEVPARERGIGFVFQNYALFRHMTVFENVAFGLRVRPRRARPPEAEIGRRVRRLLEMVQIPELERRYPDQISGGQRQRVALARALAIEPPLLLLDEPFGALDAEVRKGLRRWLRELHAQLGITIVFVTHDQDEAMELADKVAVMQAGEVSQFDPPDVLLERPANAFVAGFLGHAARLPARFQGGTLRFEDPGLGTLPGAALAVAPRREGAALAFVRPHEWEVRCAGEGPGEGPGEGGRNAVIRASRPAGGRRHLEVDLAGLTIEIEVEGGAGYEPGRPCVIRPRTARAYS
ncbi:sulfate/molybdate ABC transporter ATP-binding protein [Roseomonas sp. KE0001]|uniref:sulfate/molybdate ABC transporter ATP-binding protein n=1 Tax=Roseomonas sp. KE0001 TaxID=2479201 RepID=UPI0018DFA427|nr:ATP-binding cassette domain-containing protein [Roseomonas sp. KE0001]MBI0434705.1 ATP-binding cassette domain-containing protein [Roseomonas sp. KE0001]